MPPKYRHYVIVILHNPPSRACPTGCWSAWACGRRPPSASTAPQWPGCPGGCTFSLASRGPPSRPRSICCCGTCSGSRPPRRRPAGECTLPSGSGRTFGTSSAGTFAWKEGHVRKILGIIEEICKLFNGNLWATVCEIWMIDGGSLRSLSMRSLWSMHSCVQQRGRVENDRLWESTPPHQDHLSPPRRCSYICITQNPPPLHRSR